MVGPLSHDFSNDIACMDYTGQSTSFIRGVVEGTEVLMLVDSGASVSLISADFRMSVPALRNRPLKKNYIDSRAVNGQKLDTLGTSEITFRLGPTCWQHTFHVLRESTQCVLVGLDFLAKNHALLDLGRGVLQLWDVSVPLLQGGELVPSCCNVSLADVMTIPPLSEALVPVNILTPAGASQPAADFQGYLEPNIPETTGLVVARTVSSVRNGVTSARILNPTGEAVELRQGLHLGEFYPVGKGDILVPPRVVDNHPAVPPAAAGPVSLEESPVTAEQRAKLAELLQRFTDVFNLGDRNTGRCTLIKHHIRTGDHPTVKQRAYRAAPGKRTEIERQVAELLADGVVEESCSPWASPVVLVRKKGGQWRFCIDYRRLNAVTIKDSHPLPRVDDSLDALAGSAWFSTLDFSNGYWQVEMAEEDREKTAFTTGRGLYQWRAMPMGLTNSPATFQRMMELILRGLPWHICVVYLDDILIYSRTFSDHLLHLDEVLSRIQLAGLKLNSKKCHFARDHVVFLGHVVSRDGLQPDPRNTDKVRTWPTPRTPSEVRAFVGLCSYYRRFVRNFSQHAAPLNRLAGKNVPFEWSAECEAAFTYLRQVLTSSPVVTLPNFALPFKVYTDASKDSVGAVLSQDEEGCEKVIAYASQALTHTQKRWSTFDRELWAVVWAVREFKHYVGLSTFGIITDHRPLLGLRRMAIDNDPTGRRCRWVLELDPFDWVMVHKDGARHKNADALSRRPVSPDFVEPDAPSAGLCAVASVEVSDHSPPADGAQTEPVPVYSLSGGGAELRSAQREDPDIGVVLSWLEQGRVRRPRRLPGGSSASLRKLWTEFHRLSVMEGLLCRTALPETTGEKQIQAVVPAAMVPEILQQLHGGPAAAHFSAERVWEKAKQSCYWPFMLRDIRRWCEQCRACQTRRCPVPGPRAPMGGSQVDRPLQRVAADILELPMTSRGNRYILVVEDYFTKFVALYALPNQTAHSVARCLFEDYVLVHGVPEILHTDQGRQFEAEVIQSLCQWLGIKKTRTTAYNPKSDGMVERHNRTLIDQLAKMLLSHGGEWDTYVKQVAFAYNSSKHASTRFTPFYLMHGREARVPADVLVPAGDLDSRGTGSQMDYASTIAERLESAFGAARLNSAEARERQKLYHDQSSCHRPFSVGGLVWLNNPTERRMKLAPHWKGPYRVVQVLVSGGEAALTYRIISALDPMERAQVVHHDRLKPYTLPLPAQTVPATPVAVGSPPVVESSLPQSRDQPRAGELDNGLGGNLPELRSGQSRGGRVVRPPSHLQDFVMF